MENWLQYLFLALLSLALPSQLVAQEDSSKGPLQRIITPKLDRKAESAADLDQENIEVGLFAGFYNVEDFGSNPVAGARLAYHFGESLFLEGTLAQTAVSETSFETLSGTQILSDSQRDLSYWQVSLGYKLLPGEVFIGRNRAWHSNFYVLAGAGNTSFADNEYFTYNLGTGLQVYPTDWFALNVTTRMLSFEHEILGESTSTFNLEASFGLSIYF